MSTLAAAPPKDLKEVAISLARLVKVGVQVDI